MAYDRARVDRIWFCKFSRHDLHRSHAMYEEIIKKKKMIGPGGEREEIKKATSEASSIETYPFYSDASPSSTQKINSSKTIPSILDHLLYNIQRKRSRNVYVST